jgi:hypothetical protein
MGYAILIVLAVIFFRIGEHEYRTGWPLAGASILLSILGSQFFALFGMIGANILLVYRPHRLQPLLKKAPRFVIRLLKRVRHFAAGNANGV